MHNVYVAYIHVHVYTHTLLLLIIECTKLANLMMTGIVAKISVFQTAHMRIHATFITQFLKVANISTR